MASQNDLWESLIQANADVEAYLRLSTFLEASGVDDLEFVSARTKLAAARESAAVAAETHARGVVQLQADVAAAVAARAAAVAKPKG